MRLLLLAALRRDREHVVTTFRDMLYVCMLGYILKGCGQGAILLPMTIDMSLTIFSDMPTFPVVLML